MAAHSLSQVAAAMAPKGRVAVQFLREGEAFVWGGLRYRVERVSATREGGNVPVLAQDNADRSTIVYVPEGTMVDVL